MPRKNQDGTTLRWRLALTLGAGVLALALAATAGCTAKEEAATDAEPVSETAMFPVTITDDASRSVTIESAPKRIVSLAPGNTEILFAIGAGDRVVGVTSYDDYPAEVVDIDKVGDFQGPNLEAIAAADPDLIIATTGIQTDVIAKLEELGATVIAIDPQTIDGLYEDIAEIGQATGEVEAAQAVNEELAVGISEITEAIGDRKPVDTFLEIAQNPLFTVGSGTLLNELIEAAGGNNIVTEAGYVPYSTEQVVKSDPTVYLATKGSMSDPSALEKRSGFSGLSAVKNDRVAILDDNLVSRPGPRIVEGIRQIAEALHPDAFSD